MSVHKTIDCSCVCLGVHNDHFPGRCALRNGLKANKTPIKEAMNTAHSESPLWKQRRKKEEGPRIPAHNLSLLHNACSL